MKILKANDLSTLENHNLTRLDGSNVNTDVSPCHETESLISSDKEQIYPLEIVQNSYDVHAPYSEKKLYNAESSQLLHVLVKDKSLNDDNKKEKHPIFTPHFQVYISHFLSSWGDRMWMFAGGLFLIEITPSSLRLVAIYEAAISLTVIFFGSAVGRWVDRTSRLTAAQSSLILQNVMVCACTVLLCLMTSYKEYFDESLNGWGNILAQVGVVILSCLAQIGSLGSTLVIEKDWIVVISEQTDTQLSTMNSVLRTVDLSTKILAPVLVGFVMSFAGMVSGGIVIGVWNLVSLCFEYGLLHNLFYGTASLQKKKQGKMQNVDDGKAPPVGFTEKVKDAGIIWKLYFKHSVRDAGLGLALLYMTVLALDNFSRAFVYENGVSKAVLGILTGLASLCGILGSIAFPFLRKKIGPLKTGIFGYTFQSLCLLFCLASVFAPGSPFDPYALFNCGNSSSLVDVNVSSGDKKCAARFNFTSESDLVSLKNVTKEYFEHQNHTLDHDAESSQDYVYTSVILLLFGIVISRFGLWLADLTVTQILQEEVAENERGGINGVQTSLNQLFSLVRSVLIIILPTVVTFGYLIILSVAFVFLATALFSVYARKKMKGNLAVKE